MKITTQENTGQIILKAESDKDCIVLGRLSARLKNVSPQKFNSGYELSVDMKDFTDMLASI